MPDTNDSHGESKIIFEDYNWLIVEPFDYDAYVYNAPESKKSEWNRYRDGDVYFIIDKNNNATYAGGFKTYMLYIEDGVPYYYFWNGKELKNKKRFTEDFPDQIVQQVNNIIGNSPFYDLLLRIIGGEPIGERELEHTEDLIYSYKPSTKNPKKGFITFGFDDDDDYLSLFNLDEDDKWAYNAVVDSYDTYEFKDWYSNQEDWNEGYLFWSFNDENRELVKEMLTLLSPDLIDYEGDDEKSSDAAKLLSQYFDNEVESIIYTIMSEDNESKTRGFQEMVESDVCDIFEEYYIFKTTCFRRYYTTVNQILSLYKYVGDTTLTLTELLKDLVKDNDNFGWGENMYKIQPKDYDEEDVNKDINRELTRMFEKIENNPEFINIQDFSEMFKRVTKNFKINNRYETKYGKEFFIGKIDPTDNKITVEVFKKSGGVEKRSYTEEEFNNFLVSPELFERFIRNK